MKLSPIPPIAIMALSLANPGQASIGKAVSLACDLFCDGIASLFVEIFTKRDLNGNLVPMAERSYAMGKRQSTPGVPQFEFERCHNDLAGVTVTATSPGAGRKYLLPVHRQLFRCLRIHDVVKRMWLGHTCTDSSV